MTKSKVAILLGDDVISKALLCEFEVDNPNIEFIYILDNSVTFKKIIRLIFKRRIKLLWLLKQFYSRCRQNLHLSQKPMLQPHFTIKTNNDLLDLIRKEKFSVLFSFRAGLILNKQTLSSLPCFNLHAADTKKYPGLGAIAQAIAAGETSQPATLHEMQIEIDSGKIIAEAEYKLPATDYWRIELIAYTAAATLLYDHLSTKEQATKSFTI